jgi:hypothetical protein
MNRKAVTTGQSQAPPDFPTHVEECVQRLRGALVEALGQLGADPSAPRGLARLLGLDKTLAWKVSKIVRSRRAAAAVAHIPGASGVRILLGALERSGVDAPAVQQVRQAFAAFDDMVALHAGDRSTLELMVDSADSQSADDPRQEASRKHSFQGNGATWGVQARVRFGAQFIARSPEVEDRGDIASLGGFIDLRRLRAEARWPLVFHVPYGPGQGFGTERPLDPLAEERGGPPFLHAFCTDPLPSIEALPVPGGTLFELSEGPVGNTAAFSCAFGWFSRADVTLHQETADDYAEHLIAHTTPCELLQMDLFVHRDLPFQLPPELLIQSRMEVGVDLPPSIQRRYKLPIEQNVEELGTGLTRAASPHVPNYMRVLQAAHDRIGWNPDEFRGFRVELRYPPIPTTPMLRYPLLPPLK